MSKLRSTVYARMEEMSFRSGVVVGAGGLAVTVTAVALLVTLTGHNAAAISVAGPSVPARSAPAAPATASPSQAASPSVTSSATPVTRTSPAASPERYGPASWATAAASQVVAQDEAPSPVHLGLPRRLSMWPHPGRMSWPFPIFSRWGGPPAQHSYEAGIAVRGRPDLGGLGA